MYKYLHNKKAQSATEFAILIGIVAMVLMGMQVFVKRGIQARMKAAIDSDGQGQYEPGAVLTRSEMQFDSSSKVTRKTGFQGTESWSSRKGKETTDAP